MDHKLNGLLKCYVLFLVSMLQWRSVFPAPTHTSCGDFESTKGLTNLLKFEAKELLDEYTKIFGTTNVSVPNDAPDASISGTNIPEKLQDVYIKTISFYLHISKVEEYQKNVWLNPESVADPLRRVKYRLPHYVEKITTLLQTIEPEVPLPPTPTPPQLSHDHDYPKKVYGYGVIVRLNEWLIQVSPVLEEVKGMCNK